jgi:hypothetical protein
MQVFTRFLVFLVKCIPMDPWGEAQGKLSLGLFYFQLQAEIFSLNSVTNTSRADIPTSASVAFIR